MLPVPLCFLRESGTLSRLFFHSAKIRHGAGFRLRGRIRFICPGKIRKKRDQAGSVRNNVMNIREEECPLRRLKEPEHAQRPPQIDGTDPPSSSREGPGDPLHHIFPRSGIFDVHPEGRMGFHLKGRYSLLRCHPGQQPRMGQHRSFKSPGQAQHLLLRFGPQFVQIRKVVAPVFLRFHTFKPDSQLILSHGHSDGPVRFVCHVSASFPYFFRIFTGIPWASAGRRLAAGSRPRPGWCPADCR